VHCFLMRPTTYVTLLAAAAIMFFCASFSAPKHLTGVIGHLSATNTHVTALHDVQFSVVVSNYGPTNVTLNIWLLTNSTAVSVFDANGKILAPAAATPSSKPPPGSRSPLERLLKVNESMAFVTRLGEFKNPTPPGRYWARLRAIPSNDVLITVR
jgi:hypothetical protein